MMRSTDEGRLKTRFSSDANLVQTNANKR